MIKIIKTWMTNIVLKDIAKDIASRSNPQMCRDSNIDSRNEGRRNKYVIHESKPQCPHFGDNRCCAGCELIVKCNYSCLKSCYGWMHSSYGALNTTDEPLYMSENNVMSIGRVIDGEFDWDYYKSERKTLKNKKAKCNFCDGTGEVKEHNSFHGKSTICIFCKGEGEVTGEVAR